MERSELLKALAKKAEIKEENEFDDELKERIYLEARSFWQSPKGKEAIRNAEVVGQWTQ